MKIAVKPNSQLSISEYLRNRGIGFLLGVVGTSLVIWTNRKQSAPMSYEMVKTITAGGIMGSALSGTRPILSNLLKKTCKLDLDYSINFFAIVGTLGACHSFFDLPEQIIPSGSEHYLGGLMGLGAF